ncbi:unnamed protein product [Durusdinium trenchii]|uniref:Uncharacterized protein n=1 Tax=Durusdinium trenchii TaxID=1381693 RepID=A0ABP0IIR1_9DINO
MEARLIQVSIFRSEGVVNSEEDGLCSINFLCCNELMDESMTLSEVGIRDGDQVQLVRSPLRCLTASLDGTVRLWHLNTKAWSFSRASAHACYNKKDF